MTLLKGKWIGNNEVKGSKLLLNHQEAVRSKDSLGAEVELMKLRPDDILELGKIPRVVGTPNWEDESALATVGQVIELADIVQSTPPHLIRYVDASAADDTGSGSVHEPYKTIAAAQNALIAEESLYFNNAADFKRGLIIMRPGRYVEAAGFELKSHITYATDSSRAAVTIQVASGNIVWNAANEVNPKINLFNIGIFSPIVVNSVVAGPNIAVIETYMSFITGALTINQTAAGQFNLQSRYSRWGVISSIGTNGGYVTATLEFCQHNNINIGNSTPANDQGFVQLVSCWAGVNNTVTSYGASVYLLNTIIDNVVIDAKGFPNELRYTGHSILNNKTINGVVGDITETKLTNIVHSRYIPANNANWTIVPADPKAALDELAARIKAQEDDTSVSSLSYVPADATDWNAEVPDNAAEALDQLAQRVRDDEAALAQEIIDRTNADANLQSNIDNLLSPYRINYAVFAVTDDQDVFDAAENALLAPLFPFSDDEPATIDMGAVGAGAIIVARGDQSTAARIMMVVHDGTDYRLITHPTLSPSSMGSFLCQYDLPAPASDELPAMYIFTPEGYARKIGSVSFASGRGIVVGSYPALTGLEVSVLATDTVTEAIHKLESAAAVEKQARIDGDAGLDTRLTAAELAISNLQTDVSEIETALEAAGATPKKKVFTLNSTDISNGYVDLDHLVLAESVEMSVNRLVMYEGEDYSLSTVSGKTRVTFLGDLVSPAESALTDGEKIYFSYLFRASEQV